MAPSAKRSQVVHWYSHLAHFATLGDEPRAFPPSHILDNATHPELAHGAEVGDILH
jgi:hypothetical protein